MPKLTDVQFRRLQTATQEIQRVLAEVSAAERARHEHEDTPRAFTATATTVTSASESEVVVDGEPE